MLHIGAGSRGVFLVPVWSRFPGCAEQWSSGHSQGLEHADSDPKQTHQQSCPKSMGNFVFLEVILEL